MPILEKIMVQDFRNIGFQETAFSPNVNCITGLNGEGKTNLLDAIHYLSMTKSAFPVQDRYIWRYGTQAFTIAGTYTMESGLHSRFSIKVSAEGKKLLRDDKAIGRISSHIGTLPVVMVSPGDISLVSESGEERRRFANAVLSQMDREYLAAIQGYNKLLAQRNRILNSINSDGEVGFAYGFNVNQVECQHLIDVAAQPGIVFHFATQSVNRGEIKVLDLGQSQHFLALGIGQEFTVMVKKFERIPLLGIVRCGDNDATTSVFAHHSKFGSGRGGQSDVHHVKPHSHECAHNGIEHHAARQAGVASHNDNIGLDRRVATHERCISRRKLHDIQWREAITGTTTDGAAYA